MLCSWEVLIKFQTIRIRDVYCINARLTGNSVTVRTLPAHTKLGCVYTMYLQWASNPPVFLQLGGPSGAHVWLKCADSTTDEFLELPLLLSPLVLCFAHSPSSLQVSIRLAPVKSHRDMHKPFDHTSVISCNFFCRMDGICWGSSSDLVRHVQQHNLTKFDVCLTE